MKKWLLGLVLMFSVGVANAGFVEDSFKAGSTQEMCGFAGELMMQSVKKRLDGVPLVIRDADERTSPNPQDAIYMYNWNTLDDSDKKFYKKFIEFGYGVAERAINASNENNTPLYFPDSFQGSYTAFMAACYEKKNSTEDWFKMSIIKTGSAKPLSEKDITEMMMEQPEILTTEEIQNIVDVLKNTGKVSASSGNLGKDPIGTEEAHDKHCDELYYDINLIARFISEGEAQEMVLQLVHSSVGDPNTVPGTITQERADRLDRQVKEAYALTTPIAAWMEKEWAECR